MGLSTAKVAGLLGAVLLIALLAFTAGFLLGLDTAADLRPASDSGAGAANGDPAAASGAPAATRSADDGDTASPAADAAGADAAGADGDGADGDGADAGDGQGDTGGANGDGNAGDAPGDDGDGGGDGAAAVPGYQVLAGVHAVAARADAVARRLTQAGFEAQVVKLDDPGGTWFRVVVGGFDSLPRAREAAMQIRTEVGVDALVGPPPPQAANADPDG